LNGINIFHFYPQLAISARRGHPECSK